MEIYIQMFNNKIHEVVCFIEAGLVSRVKVHHSGVKPVRPSTNTAGYLRLGGANSVSDEVERVLLSSLHNVGAVRYEELLSSFREVNWYK